MVFFKGKKYLNHKAQAAMELAVFGAILLFVVGLIVRQSLSSSYQQNQSLKAMRWAMSMSFRYSYGMMGGVMTPGVGAKEGTSHNSASVLFIEDRLTVSSGKHAAVDRIPFMLTGSGTHTNQLFQPVGPYEHWNLPMFDVFVNGKYFPFLTAKFKTVALNASHPGWDPQCALRYPAGCQVDGQLASCTAPPADCTPVDVGCVRLKTKIYNVIGNPKWCDVIPCPFSYGNTRTERFNLDRALAPLEDDVGGSGTAYSEFSWQWFEVRAYNEAYKQGGTSFFSRAITVLNKKNMSLPNPRTQQDVVGNAVEGMAWTKQGKGEKDTPPNKSLRVDVDGSFVDGDLKLEGIVSVNTSNNNANAGIITSVVVIDAQEGDLDFTYNTADYNRDYLCDANGLNCQQECFINDGGASGKRCRPGFKQDIKMYTFVKGGTYLLNEEGKLFLTDPGKQFVRNVQRKDQIDIVERIIQLSNNTKRFCVANGGAPVGNGVQVGGAWNGLSLWTNETPNPVERCGDCYSQANADKTCMDTNSFLIYVRSRIEDGRGRKWVTDVSGDDYVGFTR